MDLIRSGRSFIFSEPPLYKPHLWFVLSDRDPANKVVAVMVRTVRPYTDPTLVLAIGDHPFIRHPSAVDYSAARRIPMSDLRAAIQSGRCHLKEDMSGELLVRVREGLLASPRTTRTLADACRKLWRA